MWVWVEEVLNYYETRLQIRREFLVEQTERARQHELDLRVCNSCEVMKSELARAHSRELELLRLLKPDSEEVNISNGEQKPINQHIPWSVRRRQLERDARANARQAKEVTVETLDEELNEVRGK